VRIDHVIWVTADLTGTADRLARTHGLRGAGGGRHVGLGTHNRVFPLGGGYLEVLAVADPEEAARSPLGRTIAAAPEGLFGWAVATEDVETDAARLGLEVTTIERDGLTARLAGVTEAMAEPWLPFFIERDAGIADPGAEGDAAASPGSSSRATPSASAPGWTARSSRCATPPSARPARVPSALAQAPSSADDRRQLVDQLPAGDEDPGAG
jgi:hypothetical protein